MSMIPLGFALKIWTCSFWWIEIAKQKKYGEGIPFYRSLGSIMSRMPI